MGETGRVKKKTSTRSAAGQRLLTPSGRRRTVSVKRDLISVKRGQLVSKET
jgi:hypothetical protein